MRLSGFISPIPLTIHVALCYNNGMKERDKKFPYSKQAAAVILLFLLGGTGMILCTVFPVRTQDGTLNNLVNGLLPRICICVPLFGTLLWKYRELLRFPRLPFQNWLWLLPPLAVAVVNFPFSALANGTAVVVRGDLWWIFALNCLFIGLTEEWFFRGILLDFLLTSAKEKEKSCFLPVLISSVAFALFHLLNLFGGAGIGAVLLQVGYSFLIGAMLAVVFCKTDNLWLCVLLHALFDVGGFLISDLGSGNPQDLVFWILTAAVGVLCAVHIILTLVKLCRTKK